jgi:hypothetical protein
VALRAVSLLLGAGFLTLSALVRCAPSIVSVADGQIHMRLFRPGPASGIEVPLIALFLFALLFAIALAAGTKVGRQAIETLSRDRRSLIWTVAALMALIVTLWPPSSLMSSQSSQGQEAVAYLVLGTLGIVLLLIGLAPASEFVARPVLSAYRILMNVRSGILVAGAALFVFVAANLVSWFVFGHTPHNYDTAAQLFQARLFTAGRTYLPSPPLAQFFDFVNGINNGRWYSDYPPGHPLMLALGVLVRAPRVINPLLGALTVVVIYCLGRELYDDRTARVATVLASLSPFLVFMSSEFMNHSSALFFTCLFLLCYAKAVRSVRVIKWPSGQAESDSGRNAATAMRNALFAGLALGMVINIRPYTALLIAIPFALDAGWRLFSEPRRYTGLFALMLAGGALMLGAYLAYNYLTTGNPLLSAYSLRYGSIHNVGLGVVPEFTFLRAVQVTQLDLNALNRYLFEFPIPALLFVVLVWAAGRPTAWDYRLLAVPLCLVAGYFFWWEHSLELFGPRREYEAFGVLALLSARGMRALSIFIRERLGLATSADRVRIATANLMLFCYLSMFVVAVPVLVSTYSNSFVLSGRTLRTVKRAQLKHAVVLTPFYDEAANENNLKLDGDVVYARDLGSLNPLLQTRYPDRRFFYAAPDTLQELTDISFAQSPLKAGLTDAFERIESFDLRDYRSLQIPVAELPIILNSGFGARDSDPGLRIITFRELSQTLARNPGAISYFLPAAAVWVRGDRSEVLPLFREMDDGTSFLLDDLRFTRLRISDNGLVFVYDIRKASDPLPNPLRPTP